MTNQMEAEPPSFLRILSFDVGLKNLAFVEILIPRGEQCKGQHHAMTIEQWRVIDVLDGQKVKRVKLEETVTRVLEYLNTTFTTADIVLIENQPCMLNPRLKSVQMVMYAYFMTMHLHTGAYPEVRLVPASGKLQGLKHAPVGMIPVKQSTLTYSQRKKLSVEVCGYYLENVMKDVRRQEQYASSNKRDDLADCMLQAIAFIEHRFV